jgi:hypothetical protein
MLEAYLTVRLMYSFFLRIAGTRDRIGGREPEVVGKELVGPRAAPGPIRKPRQFTSRWTAGISSAFRPYGGRGMLA